MISVAPILSRLGTGTVIAQTAAKSARKTKWLTIYTISLPRQIEGGHNKEFLIVYS